MTAIEVPPGIRLLATDLDGTLLLNDGTVGERTRAAIDALTDSGVHLVFVTGRPPRWLHPVADMTDHRGTAIGANGGVVIDMREEVITTVRPITTESAVATVDALRALEPSVDFAMEYAAVGNHPTESYFAIGRGYKPRWEVKEHLEVNDAEVLARRPGIIKLLARLEGHHGHDADSLLAAADDALAGLVEVTHSSPDDVLLEISGHGVTKGSTLRLVAEEFGIPREQVVAVGDMPNDIPMLLWAGTSFAVANAHPGARAAAGAVIPPNHEEGVAQVIEAVLRSG